MCVEINFCKKCPKIIYQLKKWTVTIEAMAAANFSRDVLENFYGEIPQQNNQRPRAPAGPPTFEIERNNLIVGSACGK